MVETIDSRDPVQILGLKLSTDPRWVDIQEKDLGHILNDHAYCEQKAASSCISLVVKFWDKQELVKQVSPVVSEEWMHFRAVLAELEKRDIPFEPPRNDGYVQGLISFQKKQVSREEKLLDMLLTCAMIEARSCERFRLLSLYCSDEDLRNFYYDFMVSEARHYTLFLNLADYYFEVKSVRSRWAEMLTFEAALLQSLGSSAGRIH